MNVQPTKEQLDICKKLKEKQLAVQKKALDNNDYPRFNKAWSKLFKDLEKQLPTLRNYYLFHRLVGSSLPNPSVTIIGFDTENNDIQKTVEQFIGDNDD